MFATGVSVDVSGEFSGELPVDVSNYIHFCYNSTNFCYPLSCEVSGGISDEFNLFLLFRV
jgi:hypothetical protein